MTPDNLPHLSSIAAGLPTGYEVQRFIEAHTARTQHSVSNMVLNTLGQDPQWLEREIHQRIVRELSHHISKQYAKPYDTSFGKTYTMQAIVLSPEELYALMDWSRKQHTGALT